MGKTLFKSIVLLFIFILFLSTTACKTKKPKEVVDTKEYKPYNMFIANFYVENFHGTDLSWRLDADKGYYYQNKRYMESINPHVIFYKDKQETTDIVASKGSLDQITKNINLEGSIVIQTSDGTVLTSEKVSWDDKKQKFWSDEKVNVLYKTGSTLEGYGMESDKDLKLIVFKNNVTGILNKEDTKGN